MVCVSNQGSRHINDTRGRASALGIITLQKCANLCGGQILLLHSQGEPPGDGKSVGNASVEALSTVDGMDVGSISAYEDSLVFRDEREGNTLLDWHKVSKILTAMYTKYEHLPSNVLYHSVFSNSML